MEIFQKLAGYSLGNADMVRRAMSKKKKEKIQAERQAFIYGDESRQIVGCVKNGISETVAYELFEEITDFAKYAFNKSHAASYALVSYQTAWLKYHYPLEYICAMFNNKEIENYQPMLQDCNMYNIKLLPPSINESFYQFTIEDNSIRFGFKGIKGIANELIINRIVEFRSRKYQENKYVSISDFLMRNATEDDGKYSIPDKKTTEALIRSGAFDCVALNRHLLLDIYAESVQIFKKIKNVDLIKEELNRIVSTDDINMQDKSFNMKSETELLGSIISEKPLEKYREDSYYGCTPLDTLHDGQLFVFGLIVDMKSLKTKKGDNMLVVSIQGKTGMHDVLFFRKEFDKYSEKTEYLNEVVRIKCSCNKDALFGEEISFLKPKKDSYYITIRTINDLETFNKIYRYDSGDQSEELFVTTFVRKKIKTNELQVNRIPLFCTLSVSMDLIKRVHAKKEKDIGTDRN